MPQTDKIPNLKIVWRRFVYIFSKLLIPSFLRHLDKKLRLHYPVAWSLLFHYIFWFSLIAFPLSHGLTFYLKLIGYRSIASLYYLILLTTALVSWYKAQIKISTKVTSIFVSQAIFFFYLIEIITIISTLTISGIYRFKTSSEMSVSLDFFLIWNIAFYATSVLFLMKYLSSRHVIISTLTGSITILIIINIISRIYNIDPSGDFSHPTLSLKFVSTVGWIIGCSYLIAFALLIIWSNKQTTDRNSTIRSLVAGSFFISLFYIYKYFFMYFKYSDIIIQKNTILIAFIPLMLTIPLHAFLATPAINILIRHKYWPKP
ncbi:MAG: hypothetical protein D3908_01095 [Candidatus Electrothrix sp. AUS4]|nr:hypothetical protein [Candidatus Electrothrix sp. AUS4]